jgi:hypothetical protein
MEIAVFMATVYGQTDRLGKSAFFSSKRIKEEQMNTQHHWTLEHYRIWRAWQEQISKALRRPWLLRVLLRPETRARFFTRYTQLRALPRHTRRVLQRKLAQSLAGVALLLALGQGEGLAATINVTGGCTLVDAITAANSDSVQWC